MLPQTPLLLLLHATAVGGVCSPLAAHSTRPRAGTPVCRACTFEASRRVVSTPFAQTVPISQWFAEEEALRMANDTRHGLAAGVFTRNTARAMRSG